MIQIDIAIEAEGWPPEAELLAMAETAFAATVEVADLEREFAVSLLFAGDAALRDLNREWRGQDKPTNVLSFPAPDMPSPDGPPFFGDIALALETVKREAGEQGKPFSHHLTHLLVHGLLHLAGHDHEDDGEAEEMESLERAVLARLAIPDPYAVEDVA
jgi:probable rRNA maturation factor